MPAEEAPREGGSGSFREMTPGTGCVTGTRHWESMMMLILTAVAAAAALIYLTYAMIRPERF